MRLLYTTLFYLALPLVIARLIWRSRSAPAYAERWSERFGFFDALPRDRKTVWVHAVSVGETLAALPMIRQLQDRYPDHQLLITTMTPTGSERVKAALGDSVYHVYAPYDLPDAVNRFLKRAHPDLAVIMETELWPNILRGCQRHNIPTVIANARLSEKSARGYQRFQGTAQAMLDCVTAIAAQSPADAERLKTIGAEDQKVTVTGSIKFDISVSQEQRSKAELYRNRWRGTSQRPILLAASTHEGEDELLLETLKQLQREHPDTLLVIVPRHPERFDRVTALAEQSFPTQRHSQGGSIAQQTQVLIGDSMGEMMALLGACDICFMGGSWVDNGGHNLIEPAIWAKPQFTGPSLFNFAEVSDLLLNAGGIAIVDTPQHLTESVSNVLKRPDQARAMGEAALQVAEQNKGALGRLLEVIDQQLLR